jgi:hypothetical protein
VVGSQFKVKTISPGQIRHKEPSSSSTMSLLSCFSHSPVLVKRTARPRGRALVLGLRTWLRQPSAILMSLLLTAC